MMRLAALLLVCVRLRPAWALTPPPLPTLVAPVVDRLRYASAVLRRAPAVGAPPRDAAARDAYAADGLCVVEDFFDARLFEALAAAGAARADDLAPEAAECVAVGRLGCFLDDGDAIVRALRDPRSVERLRYVAGDTALAPADYPVELRRYPIGSWMGWHRDEALYAVPQIECVLTLENDSDSETRWERADGTLASRRLPPNSLLLTRAEGAAHGVSPVGVGSRTIAKYVLAATRERLPAWYENLESYDPGRVAADPRPAPGGADLDDQIREYQRGGNS